MIKPKHGLRTIVAVAFAGTLSACATSEQNMPPTTQDFIVPEVCNADMTLPDNSRSCADQLAPVVAVYGQLAQHKLSGVMGLILNTEKRVKAERSLIVMRENCNVAETGAMKACSEEAYKVMKSFSENGLADFDTAMEGYLLYEAAMRAHYGPRANDPGAFIPQGLDLGPKS